MLSKNTKIKLFSQKIEGKPLQFDERNQKLYDAFDKQLPPGCYEQSISRATREKTSNQRKMIFGHMIEQTIVQANDLGIDVSYLLSYLLSEYEPKGQGLTKDFLHELMYIICPTTNEDGQRTTLSKMTTVQASSLFERYRTIMSGIGIVIDDPELRK